MPIQTKHKKQNNAVADFNAVKIGIASPEKILKWSHGEVLKPETINYRTQRPERDGLFDEKIFGPTKDWECYCGKYKKIRYKGVICDKCGVEITRSAVRRERMGHIELAAPAAHIWYVRGIPSILSLILDISVSDLEKIIYFAGYIALEVDEKMRQSLLEQLEEEYQQVQGVKQSPEEAEKIQALYKQTKQELNNLTPGMILSEGDYQQISLKYGNLVRVGIGAEALLEILKNIDLAATVKTLEEELEQAAEFNKKKLLKRLRLLKNMLAAKIRPEWLILTRIPVLPPDLRPMVQLDGGRFATSDLNDLYRRVINRNNRLKKLLSRGAPEVICRNEKRMLQEAVDALIDNTARHGRATSTGANQRKLRSLSDMLRGKQGRFRQNLLGKRVDYSGRSVIVSGPYLELDQCGLPKIMALELFKPFVVGELLRQGHVHNAKNAALLIENREAIVWDILEQVTADKYVLLNRAPTLHRLGIQAFKPVLIEGKAIQLHPLVCQAFNADFDGDQMAVHVPLSRQAQWEAKNLMQSTLNLLKPASGEPIVAPRLDMVFGAYYMTTFEAGAKGENKNFSSKNEAILAHQMGYLHLRAKIKVWMSLKPNAPETWVETSVGRILFNNVLPEELRFRNETMDKKALQSLVRDAYSILDQVEVGHMVNNIKNLGYEQATTSGMTIAMSDLYIPKTKTEIIKQTTAKVEQLQQQYLLGLLTDSERRDQTIRFWEKARDEIGEAMLREFEENSPVYISVVSGARGSISQLNQMAGMKGLVVNPAGRIIETPIISNFKEGFSEIEYFVSTHGARKGASDTALRTSDAGYLTRRLVDVAQDIIIDGTDCGTSEGMSIERKKSEELNIGFASRLIGRIALEDIKNGRKILVKKKQIISEEAAAAIENSDIQKVAVRSPIYCLNTWGICQNCYGRDLATGKLVDLGEAVGIMAAQAIGEPATQLTLRTFHAGGVSGEDITSGLPRVEELFEARHPKSPAIICDIEGQVKINKRKGTKILKIISNDIETEVHELPKEYSVNVKNGEIVKAKQAIAVAAGQKAIRASFSGRVTVRGNTLTIKAVEARSIIYEPTPYQSIVVKNGDVVKPGDPLTEGHLDLQKLLDYRGQKSVAQYIIHEILAIYIAQGQEISDKHLEIIVRMMLSKVQIVDPGSSDLIVGELIDKVKIDQMNAELKKEKSQPIVAQPAIFGISKIALKTESFLSAASFQETTQVLINAATRGAVDPLKGLKENVIIGRLIPAGYSYAQRAKEHNQR